MPTSRQELTIFGEVTVIADTVEALVVAAEEAGWDRLRGPKVVQASEWQVGAPIVVFVAPRRPGLRHGARVVFTFLGGELRLVIDVQEGDALSLEEHNALVAAAARDLVVPAVIRSDALYSLTPPDAPIEEFLPAEVVRLLRTMRSEPPRLGDAGAWDPLLVELVVLAHARGCGLTGAFLRSWLGLDDRWEPDAASWVAGPLERVTRRLHTR